MKANNTTGKILGLIQQIFEYWILLIFGYFEIHS